MFHNIKYYKANKYMETITIFLFAISCDLRFKIVRSSEMLANGRGTTGFLIPESSNFYTCFR
jgi:hypothetical protein